MKRFFYFAFIAVLVTLSACNKFSFKPDPKGTWQREIYTGVTIRDMCQSPSGNYYYAGDNGTKAILCATDAGTSSLWENEFEDENFRSVKYTSDENLIVVGMKTDGVQDIGPAVLAKFDTLGNQLWRKEFMYNTRTKIYDVVETEDGGFLMCGYATSSNDAGYTWSFALVIKTDKDGNEVWNKLFGDPQSAYEYHELYKIAKVNDNYVLVGLSETYSEQYGYFLNITKDGTVIKEEVTTSKGIFHDVIHTTDDNLMIIGDLEYENSWNVWALKTDLDFGIIWEKTDKNEHTNGYHWAVVETEDEGFITVGGHSFRYNKSGKLLWTKTTADYFGALRTIIQTIDGYYITTGGTTITKMDSDGNYEKED